MTLAGILGREALAAPDSVSITIRNLSGSEVRIYWLQPGKEPRNRIEQTPKPIGNASQTSINSYFSHEFVIVGGAGEAFFAVGHDQEFLVVAEGMQLQRHNGVVSMLESALAESWASCVAAEGVVIDEEDSEAEIPGFEDCMAEATEQWLQRLKVELEIEHALLQRNLDIVGETADELSMAKRTLAGYVSPSRGVERCLLKAGKVC